MEQEPSFNGSNKQLPLKKRKLIKKRKPKIVKKNTPEAKITGKKRKRDLSNSSDQEPERKKRKLTELGQGLFKAIENDDANGLNLLLGEIELDFDLNIATTTNARNRNGDTPLHQAVCHIYPEVMDIPFPNGDENFPLPIEKIVMFSEMPSPRSVSQRNLEIIETLLRYGANPNSRNMDYNTPLHKAVTFNNPKIVETLLDNGADPKAQNYYGDTPVDRALSWHNREIIEVLSKNLDDPRLKKWLADNPTF